ncbi:MAG: histidinol-phosphatase HisJ family protein [Ruminococcaceae bacterium]|nr:histidinol-phosphatase HisJ family protein [Oscillospiraceae bacterium]
MKVNLHTHTHRCGHASGSEREYIERAIAGGITHMGFSEHAPFAFPDGHESTYRVPMSQAKDYMDTVRALREEYKNDIKIYVGFEMEYYPLYFRDMLNIVNGLGAEYLILGQHYVDNEYPPQSPYVCTPNLSEEKLCQYADNVIEGIESGVFSYVAHPDVFNFFGDDEIYDRHMRRICKSAKEYGLPLEINFLGIRSRRIYPKESFWRIAGEEGCEAVFGLDAHAPNNAYDEGSLPLAEWLVNKYGLKISEYPTLTDPKTNKKFEL